MGRKRLLTILAAVTAALSLQVGTATAQISLPGLGEIDLGADECLEIGVDISLTDALQLDPNVCISEDGVEIEGGADVLGERVDVGEATEPVEDVTEDAADAVEDVAEKAAGAAAGAADPSPAPSETPTEAPSSSKGGDGDAADRGSAGTTTGPKDTTRDPDVATSGEAQRPSDAARDARLGALRALRSDLAASSPSQRGIAGPVETLGALSSPHHDLAAPQVADAAPGEVVPGVDERLAPEVATSSDPEEAVLATSSPMGDLAEAPIALQLLASALVLGAAAVWTIAARELGRTDGTTA